MVKRITKEEAATEFQDLWEEVVGRDDLHPEQEIAIIEYADVTPREQYELYLLSKHWKQLRKMVLERDGYQCVECGATVNLNVHHKRYRGPGEEHLKDLEVLCQWCHNEVTELRDLEAVSGYRFQRQVSFGDDKQLFELLRNGAVTEGVDEV